MLLCLLLAVQNTLRFAPGPEKVPHPFVDSRSQRLGLSQRRVQVAARNVPHVHIDWDDIHLAQPVPVIPKRRVLEGRGMKGEGEAYNWRS